MQFKKTLQNNINSKNDKIWKSYFNSKIDQSYICKKYFKEKFNCLIIFKNNNIAINKILANLFNW